MLLEHQQKAISQDFKSLANRSNGKKTNFNLIQLFLNQ